MANSCDEREKFMEERAALPAISSYLFGHERYLKQTLCEYIFKPGTAVEVSSPLKDVNALLDRQPIKYGTVDLVCGDNIFVTFNESETNMPNNDDCFSLDRVNLVTKLGSNDYDERYFF